MRKLTDQERARREKLGLLRSSGLNPYPARIGNRTPLRTVREQFARLERQGTTVNIAGRVRAIRVQGGSTFVDLNDGSAKLQCFLSADGLGNTYEPSVAALDIGDFVWVEGAPFTTKRGEQTVRAASVRIIGKSLRPLPDKWHGLEDVEIRYRHRELDLIANPEVKNIFLTRGKIIDALRDFLVSKDFFEVETPILQSIPGGATARPFATHHNALDVDLYLRIAPELFLKRLIIGGFERIFEIARCFRNEGIDYQHNPEFTQVELYAAYMDYTEMMDLTEELLRTVTNTVLGALSFTYDNEEITLPKHFPRRSFRAVIEEYAGIDIDDYPDAATLFKKAKQLRLEVSGDDHRGKILDEIFKALVRPRIINPVFVTDHPIELSPLAKKKEGNPRYAERFQLLIAGAELCNAFSELNDPIDQRARFEEQEKLRKAGDEDAQRIDEEFIEALEYGMPPTSGLGIGIDRLTMLLTNNHSIKEVIAFPTLKPKPPSR